MPTEIAELRNQLEAYLEQARDCSQSKNTTHLLEICNKVERHIQTELDPEFVHLLDEIYTLLGKTALERRVALHRRYKDSAPNVEERFWSNWHLVDTLAVLRHNKKTIIEQQKFYRWAYDSLTVGHQVKTFYDSTQARCWIVENETDAWFQLYDEILNKTNTTQVDRRDLCQFLLTGAEIAALAEKYVFALKRIEQLESNNRNDTWPHYIQFWLGATTSKLEIFRKQNQWEQHEQLSSQVIAFIEQHNNTPNKKISAYNLAWVAHDIGACLMWAKKYEKAKYLFQTAIHNKESGGSHFFLSVCIWALSKDREKTLYHLRYAQNTMTRNTLTRGLYHQFFLDHTEFEDVWQDPEFLTALNEPTNETNP